MTPGFARVDFAGPGGASLGMRRAGVKSVGIEFNKHAVATARAAGMDRWLVDVTSRECRGYAWPPIWLYQASPPCQSWSMGGKGEGRKHMQHVIDALQKVAAGMLPEDAVAAVADDELDVRTVLSLEPMNVIRDHRPPFIWFEQVPPVLPVWEAYAEILRSWGYSVWTGQMQSEQYGVPQTRKRAILMARSAEMTELLGEVAPPVPTHSKFYSRSPEKLDDGVLPWVSMAQALNWGMTQRPAMTVTGGGSTTGGAEPFGNQARRAIEREAEEGRWALRGNQKPNGIDYQERGIGSPAQTITGETGSYKFVQRSNYSASGKPGQTAEERGRTERPVDLPSVAITGKGFRWVPEAMDGGRSWHPQNGAYSPEVIPEAWVPEPGNDKTEAADMEWSAHRPSPTIVGSFKPEVVAAPGYRKPGDGPRQEAKGSIRVSVQEAGILQSFPPDYPWQGNKGQQFQQVGDAVPPLLAEAITRALVGLDASG